MEHRLNHASLPQVQIAFAGEQALAEYAFDTLQRKPLAKAVLLGDQHILRALGVVQNINAAFASFQINPITELCRGAGQKWNRVFAKSQQAGHGIRALGPGGTRTSLIGSP